ncbi:MAG: sugar phosphate isomerase/epimerase family protein [Planctomycetota bacterium]|jgi:sugar phosphate isomerase/epimerase
MGKGPLAERVRWAADKGFDAVSFDDAQLTADGPGGVGREVERLLGRLGLAVTVHPSPGPRGSPEKEEAFGRAVERAAELQKSTGCVRSIGIDPAWVSEKGVVVYDAERTERALEGIARATDGLGVAVAVENWKINPEADEFHRLSRALDGSDLRLLLDLGHLHVMHEDTVAAAREVPLRVCEVHVSDNKGRSDDHMPLGRGSMPVAEIARVMRERGEDCIWTLEMRARFDFAECTISNPRARRAFYQSRDRLRRALDEAEAASPRADA